MSDKRLPRLQFRTNIPERLTFPYGNAKRIPSQNPNWKPSYMFTVESEDKGAHTLFATEYLYSLLVEQGIGRGGIADITRAEGDTDPKTGRPKIEWKVDVIDPGQPVKHVATSGEEAPSAAPGGAGGAPAASVGPGSRDGAEGRLAELGAAYAACVEEAKGVWLRSGAGIHGLVDFETIHSTATSFFISLQREGFDLGVFANTFGESPGLQALRKLAQRVHTEPHLSDVRDHFTHQLQNLPTDPSEQRSLYAALLQAVRTMTQVAADQTPPPEDEGFEDVDLSDLRVDEHITKLKALAREVWPENGQAQEGLNHLTKRVTKDEVDDYRDVTPEVATTMERVLNNMKARMKPARAG